MRKPTFAIVGRPNVGKSTLFNKLIGERISIVEDTPGVTRDRIYAEGEWRTNMFCSLQPMALRLSIVAVRLRWANDVCSSTMMTPILSCTIVCRLCYYVKLVDVLLCLASITRTGILVLDDVQALVR